MKEELYQEREKRTLPTQRIKEMIEETVRERERLQHAYKCKEKALYGVLFGSLAYGILVTVFTGIGSNAVKMDFKTFFMFLWYSTSLSFKNLQNGANFVAEIGNKIPNEIGATILYWSLWILVYVGISFLILFLLYLGVKRFVKYYAKEYADNFSLTVVLVSLAFSTFFADEIRAVLPMNLLLLNLLIHAFYLLVRWYVKGCRRSRGYR